MSDPTPWTTTIVSMYPRTGLMKEGSRRVIRSATPPPPPVEDWPRAQKFGGDPTPVFIHRSVASASWSVDRGFSMQPAELAAHLIATGHARLAKPGEMPVADE